MLRYCYVSLIGFIVFERDWRSFEPEDYTPIIPIDEDSAYDYYIEGLLIECDANKD